MANLSDWVTDSQQVSYLGAKAGRKNLLINGSMDIWQRGAGAFSATSYTADRWLYNLVGASGNVSQLSFNPGTTNGFGNPSHFLRINIATSSTVTEAVTLQQRIEEVQKLSGQTVTLSFWARTGTQPLKIGVEIIQNFGTGGTPSATVANIGSTVFNITEAGWNKYTHTISIPSISGKTLGTDGNDYTALRFWVSAGTNYSGFAYYTGYQTGIFDFTILQLEIGTAATDFERVPKADELLRCKRYFHRLDANAASGVICNAMTTNTINSYGVIALPEEMRIVPTVTMSNGLSTVKVITISGTGTTAPVDSIQFATSTKSTVRILVAQTGAFSAGGLGAWMAFVAGTDWLSFDAEL